MSSEGSLLTAKAEDRMLKVLEGRASPFIFFSGWEAIFSIADDITRGGPRQEKRCIKLKISVVFLFPQKTPIRGRKMLRRQALCSAQCYGVVPSYAGSRKGSLGSRSNAVPDWRPWVVCDAFFSDKAH